MDDIKLEVGDSIRYNFSASDAYKKMSKALIIKEIKGEKIYYKDDEIDYVDEVLACIKDGTAILTKGEQPKLTTFPILIKLCIDNTYVVIMSPEKLPTNEAFMVVATKVVIRE